ncbi:hypothetical protein GQ53DRAFT_772900 [Thozetella sp. PMI_491]|nr:hypothetical protein GQ53DRAFT_772900 [Thozetella sp. PMI_491]
MLFFKAASLMAFLATSASFVSAECYGSGDVFWDLYVNGGTVDDAIKDFCTNIVPRTYQANQKVTHCYNYDKSQRTGQFYRMNMELTNVDANNPQFLSYEGCYRGFQVERTACQHGSQIVKKSRDGGDSADTATFYYYIDPNEGQC